MTVTRYSVSNVSSSDVHSVGAVNIKSKPLIGVTFADLDSTQVALLRAKGASVAKVGRVKPGVIAPPLPITAVAIHTIDEVLESIQIEAVINAASPQLLGQSQTVAILDTGILETHELIGGRIVLSINFTSDQMADVFDHGTGIASIIASTAPMAGIINMKVLDSDGVGTTETVIDAMEECISLHDNGSALAPSVVNVSVGSEDDGDPNDVLRLGVRALLARGMLVVVAAGNSGPSDSSIMTPAVEELATAVGSIELESLGVSGFSSRGPTSEGIVKPDIVMIGENVIVASSADDSATVPKSGTSFSAPFVSGIALLMSENVRRVNDSTGIHPGAFFELLPSVGVKPSGAPVVKDNDYGYGMMYGPLVASALGAEPTQEAGSLDSIVVGLVSVGMIGMMAGAMES